MQENYDAESMGKWLLRERRMILKENGDLDHNCYHDPYCYPPVKAIEDPTDI